MATSAGAKKWQEFPALEATRRMNSINSPAMFEGLASSQIAFAAAMADMMRSKDGPDAKKKPVASLPAAPAAFDKDMLARLAQMSADAPEQQEEEAVVEEQPPEPSDAPPVQCQLPPGFSLVSFETEEEAAQALQEMEDEEEPPPPPRAPEMATLSQLLQQPGQSQTSASSSAPVIHAWETSSHQHQTADRGVSFSMQGGSSIRGEKTNQVRSIVDNVMGAWKVTAASSAASAAVAPPVAKALTAPRASVTADQHLPPGASDIYLPPGTGVPAQSEELAARKADRRERSRSRRRSRSGRGRRPSPRRASPRRRPSPRRSRSRKRSSMFSTGPQSGTASATSSRPTETTGASSDAGRGNKFSDTGNVQLDGQKVPDWLKDLAEPQIPRALLGRKVLRMPDAYIKCLIGRGGETIRNIINKTGADIRIDAKHDNLDGIVSIANNIEAAEKLIKEILASKGCHWQTEQATDMGGALTNVGWKGHVDDDDLQIPTELVGLFIGNAGAGIKEIKARVGGAVTIKVLPPLLPGGFQVVQVVGENWRRARELVRAKIKEILTTTPGRWHAPGFSSSNPNLSGASQSGGGGPAAFAGYMPSFGATPGLSTTREVLREGKTMNVVYQGTSL